MDVRLGLGPILVLGAISLGTLPPPCAIDARANGCSAVSASEPTDRTKQTPQDPGSAPTPPPRWVDDLSRFAFAPPSGWRTLTPDEGRTLSSRPGSRVPSELREPQPPRFLVFGAIDVWLNGDYDGRALTVLELDGEVDVGPEGIAAIAKHWSAQSIDGRAVQPERIEASTVGRDGHPAVLGLFRVGAGAEGHARFDAYVPSGGQTYTFAMVWPLDDLGAGEAAFAAVCDSLAIAAKPRGAVRLGSKLLWAGLLGLGIGVLLHAVRKRARG